MAKKGKTYDGRYYCLECGSEVSADDEKCPSCGQDLTEEVKAFNCPSCGAPVEFGSQECENCGRKFKIVTPEKQKEEKPLIQGDEEFLSRLLDWGRKKYETETVEDIEEKKEAEQVFKVIVGAEAAPQDKNAIEELKTTAEEKEKIIKREADIGRIAEPLYNLITSRKKAIDEAEAQLIELRQKLDELKGSKKDKDKKKEKDIKRRIKKLEKEKHDLENIENGIKTIETVFKQLMAAHERQLAEKEAELEKRLKEFRKEMERRQKEKLALKKKEEELNRREKELEKRVAEIADREIRLAQREEEVKRELESLKKDHETLQNIVEQEKEMEGNEGFSEEEKEKWLEEQRRLQAEIFQLRTGKDSGNLEEGDYKGLDAALKEKIKKLEDELIRIQDDRELMRERLEQAEEVEAEVKRILKILDDLLENLPDEIIEKFANSEDFKLYEKILDRYGI